MRNGFTYLRISSGILFLGMPQRLVSSRNLRVVSYGCKVRNSSYTAEQTLLLSRNLAHSFARERAGHEQTSRCRRVDVLRANAISKQTPWNAPQQRPLHHFHEQWCSRPLALVCQRRPDQIVLHDNLQALGYARWKFPALLDLFERLDRYCSAP